MNEVMTSFSARVPKRLIDSLKDEAWERRVSLAQLIRDLFEQVHADRQGRPARLPANPQGKAAG